MRGRIFANPAKKEEMLSLRRKGYSYIQLSRKYKVDHTTIIHHCQMAGLALGEGDRVELFKMLKSGVDHEEISLQLRIRVDTIKYYIEKYGELGNKVYARQSSELTRIAKKIKFKRTKIRVTEVIKIRVLLPEEAQEHVVVREMLNLNTPEPVLTKVDERGVEWITNNEGGWTCIGMSKEGMKRDEEVKKRRVLELKRLQMLNY